MQGRSQVVLGRSSLDDPRINNMTPDELINTAKVAAYILGPAGAAWVGVKSSLNGLRNQVKDLHISDRKREQDLGEIKDTVGSTQQRVARIEGLLEVPRVPPHRKARK
jgi:hypothetical protein